MFDFLTTATNFLMTTGKKIIAGPSKVEDEDYSGSDLAAGFIKKGAKAFIDQQTREVPSAPDLPEIGVYRQFLKRPTTQGGATPVRQIGTNSSLFQDKIQKLTSSINPDVAALLRQSGITPTLQQGRRTLGLAPPTTKA